MGMFDNIKYNFKGNPLLVPDELHYKFYGVGHTFQTKDFDCAFDFLEVKDDGKLYVEKVEYEFVYPDKKHKPKSVFDKLPKTKKISSEWQFLDITQTIEIYDFVCNNDENYDYWISYVITFVKGEVSETKLLEFKKQPNDERKKTEEKFKSEYARFEKISKTKKYKYFYKPYNKIILKTFKIIRKCLEKIKSFSFYIEEKLKIKF